MGETINEDEEEKKKAMKSKVYSINLGNLPPIDDYYEPESFKLPAKTTRRVTISEDAPIEISDESPSFTPTEYICKTNPAYKGGRRSRYSTFISGIDQFDPYQELTGMQIAAFRQVFDMVDKDGGGSIDAEELYNSMKDLESNLSLDEIKEILEELDRDGNGEIDFEEFLYMMTSMSMQIKEAQVEEAQKTSSSKRRQSIFFSVITKFAMKHSLKEIERYYASKARYTPHVVGHYAAGARVDGLSDRELRQTWKDFSKASRGKDSPYAQPLNFVISSSKGPCKYQKKTIRIKKHDEHSNNRLHVTPSPKLFDRVSKTQRLSPPPTSPNDGTRKSTKIGWTPRHRLPITKVGLPVVRYDSAKLNVNEMDRIRERVNDAKCTYYIKLKAENSTKAEQYWQTLKADEIESERLSTNFERVFRAYSPTNDAERKASRQESKRSKKNRKRSF